MSNKIVKIKQQQTQKNVYVSNALSIAHKEIQRSLSHLHQGNDKKAKILALSALKKIAEAIAQI